MDKYNVTIGLEMHCEGDKTNTKVFSSSKNGYSEKKNVNISPVDLGLPGVLPVVNIEAIKQSLMMSMILNCKQPEYMYFLRKNYYYPDLPKGYQITQNPPYDCVGMNGEVEITRDDGTKFKVGVDNIHLEEDSARLEHLYDTSLIDYNRAGVPLFELVTTPSIHSADDAIYFLEYIRSIYQYCNISSADSKKGQLRCDVNVSISKDDKLGTKVEVKNVNSFSGVREAILYEIKRQSDLMDEGRYDEVVQETRRWDEESGTTISMRLKVDAEDYKYFVEPNIPKYKISKEWLDEIRKQIPRLRNERKEQYINEYGLSDYDSTILVKEKAISDYFEETIKLGCDPKKSANWVNGMILSYLNSNELSINDFYLTPQMLTDIISLVDNNTISGKQAKEVFAKSLETKKEPKIIIKEENMSQITNEDEIVNIVLAIINEHEDMVLQYKNGKTNLADFFVGQVMKQTRGKANPSLTREIVLRELNK